MKNLLKIILISIITGFIASSCGKQMSITKRKYNKGYYVSHSHKRSDPKIHPGVTVIKSGTGEYENPIIVTSEKKKVTVHETEPALIAAVSGSNYVKPKSQNLNTRNDKNKFTGNYYKVKRLDSFLPTRLYTAHINKKLSADSTDEALSLLWIIIVIILIVYLLGLAMDGFGLGLAIHLLALIALILLILWLARIL